MLQAGNQGHVISIFNKGEVTAVTLHFICVYGEHLGDTCIPDKTVEKDVIDTDTLESLSGIPWSRVPDCC